MQGMACEERRQLIEMKGRAERPQASPWRASGHAHAPRTNHHPFDRAHASAQFDKLGTRPCSKKEL